jgi:phosphoglycerate dehydrogenase-like enzyme
MKPIMILDNHFRKKKELFRDETYAALTEICEIHGGIDAPMPRDEIDALLPEASFYVSALPELNAQEIEKASKLKATIEVAGAFREGLDYASCLNNGIDVLSCSPGFRNSVAEMTLAMMLAGGRGLIAEHEAFRSGNERWLDDRDETDFSLYNQTVGFIGYGQIARETHRLIAPFSTNVMAYDPFLSAAPDGVTLVDLETLVKQCRVVVMAAVPSEETRGLLSAELIAQLQNHALVIVVSRAWCVDFDALISEAASGRITVATDVFPDEPLSATDPIRRMKNVILSPHRAAAVPGGRHLIGDMILHDVRAILQGGTKRMLKPADLDLVQGLVSAQNQLNSMPNT